MPRTIPLAIMVCAVSCAAQSAPHPLAPLTADEMRQAVRIFRASNRFPSGGRFSILTLEEPPKEMVLRGAPVPRRAFAVIYDGRGNHTFEGVADLAGARVDSWREIAGAQPPIDSEDSAIADRVVRSDPRWRQALVQRGIRNLDNILTVAWTAGHFGLPGTETARIVRVLAYAGGYGSNYEAHPVEGLVAHVDLTHGRILDLLDTGRDIPLSRENWDLDARSTAPLRASPAPLTIVQTNGPGFQIENGEVRWQKWRFRYALTPREGLVLYTVGYEDGGRVRPVMYRGSLSEMVVPYGDPGGAWFFRNSFDAGELGLGSLASPLRVGADCPTNCTLFDAVMAREDGEPNTIRGAVAIYEKDAGIAWKHADHTRRARDLVIGYSSQAGNYQYGFDWIFHQNGAIEMRVDLTGLMSVKGVNEGHDPYSHLVARNLAAVHHQHFFTFRLDLDVDGAAANRVVELNSAPVPAGPQNLYGGAFTMTETTLATERDAQRRLNLQSSRRWIVESLSAKNALGHPTGYALIPGENAVPFAQPDSWVLKRAGFLNSHLWVTAYRPGEIFAGGDYPNQSKGGDGLSKWASGNRPVDNHDVVVWYTMGITHNPRPEDWPVMPVHSAGFMLEPWGFFSRNPALDLPPR